ncbi:glycosyltransferase family 2 protein [Konateibacter massiliensis]|uniref:glycosyltransferase family 2 protein n=1 Tax=Konateibacter massiliensis TaxID=2002841 RepID=UPI000C15DA49|nr:glycosyltransferase family 2 protein [Konateibacter massiliensis]
MITISVCMIVKNEEEVLARCLESLKPIADEIIIIDTGSTDRTKEIASYYTDKIFDYEWQNDFAHARNFSFSKASMDYIYTADADEVIDGVNIERFFQLKRAMLFEVEIVQMKYTNQLQYGTTYNFETEYRPKLFKRLREFAWINPIHETVNLEPVIYDSEIEIIHMPLKSHAERDFSHILKVIKDGHRLSKKLFIMYAKELFIAGQDKDFLEAESYFVCAAENEIRSAEELKAAQCVLTKCARLTRNHNLLLKSSLKNFAGDGASAEVCYELGEYFFKEKDYNEAAIWFYNAAFETECELNIHYAGDYPLKRLAEIYEILQNPEQQVEYERLFSEWELPKSLEHGELR